MLDVWRVKKTKQIVYPLGAAERNGYTLCLFPFKHVSRNGKRGDVRAVKSDNLVKDRETF